MSRVLYAVGGSLAVRENGVLVEYMPLASAAESTAEAIYLGRVTRVMSGMDAAFVDLGQQRNGFLPLQEKSKSFQNSALRPGSRVPVQVQREAHGEKGAYLTRDISLCGEYVLLMPMNRYIGVSARVSAEDERNRLRALGAALAGDRFGLVMRAASVNARRADVAGEVEELYSRWTAVQAAVPTAHAPSLLYRPRSSLRRLLDDYLPRGIDCLYTDEAAAAESAAGLCPVQPAKADEALALRAEAKQASAHRVWLKNGGNLVVDECEALTVIDVNTAKFTGSGDSRHTVLQANLEACAEIARQLRLRNLGGIILIDLIDMQGEAERERVLSELETACAADRVKTNIHGFTSLGLVEMTRKRSGRTLREQWTDMEAEGAQA